MKFKFKCKVCGEELPEGSNFLKHLLKHPVVIYFDMIPVVEWVEQKSKKQEPIEAEEPDQSSANEDTDDGED